MYRSALKSRVSGNGCTSGVKTKEHGNVNNRERRVYQMRTACCLHQCVYFIHIYCIQYTYVMLTFKFQWFAFSNKLNEKIPFHCISYIYVLCLLFFFRCSLLVSCMKWVLPYMSMKNSINRGKKIQREWKKNSIKPKCKYYVRCKQYLCVCGFLPIVHSVAWLPDADIKWADVRTSLSNI